MSNSDTRTQQEIEEGHRILSSTITACTCCILSCAASGWFIGSGMNVPGSQTNAMVGAAVLGLCACACWASQARAWS